MDERPGRPPPSCPAHAMLEAAPACPGRRGLLFGLGLGAAGSALGLAARAAPLPAAAQQPTFENDGTEDAQPVYGAHQPGILTPQPAASLFAAFDVLASDRNELIGLMKLLSTRIAFLMQGGDVPQIDPKLPPADSGLMGAKIFPDNLTLTVGFGASLFDERFGLAAEKPRHLVAMEQFPNDALDGDCCHGDVLIQICSNTAETNIHALRDIIKQTPALLSLRWTVEGFLPPHTIKKLGRDTVRNLLGFKDGTANLDARNDALMETVVWTKGANEEPAWTEGGTYQVVRKIRMLVERWDRTPLGEQQAIIGRTKMEGAPFSGAREHDLPDYATDREGHRTPLDAHIRLANPRTPETERNLILRRPYNFSNGITKAGQLDMGLLFVSFQANLSEGFIAVQNRLNGEPLEEYIKPVGGGYYFALPGVPAPGRYLGQSLLERTT